MKTQTRSKFLSRLLKFRHLEFDSALQQVLWTVTQPKRLFRYHQDQNEMRGQWCRDDPAFLLLLCAVLGVSSLVFSAWMRLSASGYLLALLWAVLGDGLVAGTAVATATWMVGRHALKKPGPRPAAVEWAYCFDIHLNALFPLLLSVYLTQMLAWPCMLTVLSRPNLVSCFFSNALWSAGLLYYIYITFLGFTVLPMLQNTMALLYASLPVLFLFLLSFPFGWNYTVLFQSYHTWRTGG